MAAILAVEELQAARTVNQLRTMLADTVTTWERNVNTYGVTALDDYQWGEFAAMQAVLRALDTMAMEGKING